MDHSRIQSRMTAAHAGIVRSTDGKIAQVNSRVGAQLPALRGVPRSACRRAGVATKVDAPNFNNNKVGATDRHFLQLFLGDLWR